jgi:hypothetical protein
MVMVMRLRICLRCSSRAVDDEAHCPLQKENKIKYVSCAHPTLDEALDTFLAAIVPPLASQHLLSTYLDFWALAATGRVPLPVFVKYVAVCVRVCWFCHRSGGTNVVAIPDVFLPADAYLYMFDSESDSSGDLGHSDSDAELVEVSQVTVVGRSSVSGWVSVPFVLIEVS